MPVASPVALVEWFGPVAAGAKPYEGDKLARFQMTTRRGCVGSRSLLIDVTVQS
jgi:hypothetical protein